MKKFILTLLLHTSLYGSIDLDELAQDFVLETKKIEIPGYPHAFNPSIIPFQDGFLMTFRVILNPSYVFISHIGILRLDHAFNPIGTPQLFDFRESSPVPSRAEDARLIYIGSRLWMVYTDNPDVVLTKGGFRVFLTEITYDGLFFNLQHIEKLSNFEGETPTKREKNWVPFDYNGEMLLSYSLSPHIVFKPHLGTDSCETVVMTQKDIPWNWGDLRGGTTGLKINDTEYLSFFHSSIPMESVHSNGVTMPHYFMAAYTFSSEYPFEITSISPEPIFGTNFYHGAEYQRYWGSIRCVFPCGHIVDGDYIWISYGRQDHEVWIVKLDKQGLLNSLNRL